ncbi:MAG: TA system VapC family ribonuclease toxin [Solirubrobacteraceae bacterium]
MKLPDVNLFVYAADETSAHHGPAREWVEKTMSGTETVALAWLTLIGFVRLTTNPRSLTRPWGVSEALDVVDGWLAQPAVTVVHPTDRHAAVLRDLLAPLGTAGNLTSDAHLAALAIEHGATLCSSDNDFSRFAGLRWVDPLRV